MPTKAVRRFTSWSWSRLRDWRQCGAFARWKHLDKPRDAKGQVIVEVENAAMTRGSGVHIESEKFVRGELTDLPSTLQLFAEEYATLRKAKQKGVEEMWAFTRDWYPCKWDDWSNAWLRVKVDAWHRAKSRVRVIDVKTGRMYGSYDEQLRIYAVAAFTRFEKSKSVNAENWFLDQGEIVEREYDRAQFKTMREQIEAAVEPMMQDTLFSPTPGPACRRCIFASDKGGPCVFNSNAGK